MRPKFYKELVEHIAGDPPAPLQYLFARAIEALLSRIERGRLRIILPNGTKRVFGPGAAPGREAGIRVNDNAFFSRIALHGEIGLGESYVEGLWDSEDLPGALEVLIDNRHALRDGNIALSVLSRARNFRLHCSRPNTLCGSRANIEAHYDLSADFYRTFLDETMTYSCGIFRSPADTLEQAQRNKMHAVMGKARIGRDDHVLEIGCGWGGLAIEAVRTLGCSWTGITISRAQYDHARAWVKRKGLEDRIEILLEDYRTVRGTYDRIVSIEMLEAVGHEYLGEFFSCCDSLLKPDGIAVLQVITIPDSRYDLHRSRPNWIQKHIFPGGMLPSLTAMCTAMTARSGLLVESVENIGNHYAQTLKNWRERFSRAGKRLMLLGFDEAFQRKWIYYLSICEAQFRLRVLGDLQLVLTREGNRDLRGVI
ncbi:MAG TPA: cyclopropane-fatty-acyl-phospholipid synthase family protein [Deltaproteobacteria bacterium]|nr:cyclopropane-fatty-acyl-phospholipid synthase family protein [Deltaproteobacteria bacterium]HPR54722.1 cyclopropane-fatty-acyl-phospholipid synthase family protein [Deltaproteobacteria bacterium]HXK48269.1 cyclopropane-fatty-acyl-phospholipid synthase family protein [Deltaproteobacteria bacterium]